MLDPCVSVSASAPLSALLVVLVRPRGGPVKSIDRSLADHTRKINLRVMLVFATPLSGYYATTVPKAPCNYFEKFAFKTGA